MASTSRVIIGIDSSTQSTKLEAFEICNDSDGTLRLGPSVFSTKVSYTDDLPELCHSHGEPVHLDDSTGSAKQPPSLWFAALDVVLLRAKTAGVTLRAAAVSLSAQQHAAVYWGEGISPALAACGNEGKAVPTDSISDVFYPALALREVPIWMDSSTSAQCAALARAVSARRQPAAAAAADSAEEQHHKVHTPDRASSAAGASHEALQDRGDAYLAAATGSSAYERFTLPQCVAVANRQPEAFCAVRHVRLLSAALTCVLTGALTPHDAGDAAGMNALRLPCAPPLDAAEGGAWQWDQRVSQWANAQFAAAGSGCTLHGLLGDGVDVSLRCRPPSWYITERFGLSAECVIVTGTGDNPCALAGLVPQYAPVLPPPAGGGECTVLSLGTSDTVLDTSTWRGVTPQPGKGHVLPDPLRPETHCMTMLCVKNGGLVRQRLAEGCAGGGAASEKKVVAADWIAFDGACSAHLAALKALTPGDSITVGLLLPLPEIAPRTTEASEAWWQATLQTSGEVTMASVSAPGDALQRAGAAALGQVCNLAVHAHALAGGAKRGGQLRVTGGGAKSAGFVALASHVFGCNVYSPSGESAEGAARGAAVRAFHAWAEAIGASSSYYQHQARCSTHACSAGGAAQEAAQEAQRSPGTVASLLQAFAACVAKLK